MNLLVFFQGGLGYTELWEMPIPELCLLHEEAARVNRELEKKV